MEHQLFHYFGKCSHIVKAKQALEQFKIDQNNLTVTKTMKISPLIEKALPD